jgi:hypothetical protein
MAEEVRSMNSGWLDQVAIAIAPQIQPIKIVISLVFAIFTCILTGKGNMTLSHNQR